MNKPTMMIICLLLVIMLSCQDDEIPGLVVKYSFSSNTLDFGGDNNHAAGQGTKGTADRFGNNNSAYWFNGRNASIAADVSGMPRVEATQSISLWFRIDSIPTYKHERDAHNMIALVDTNDGVGVQFGFRAPGYNSLGFDVWYWGGRTIMESEQPALNEWHHCVYTYDGQLHKFYINGKKVAESTAEPQTGNPDILMLGNYPGGDQFFAGSLDDVSIYNRELSQSEINRLFTSGTKPDMRE